MLHARSLILLLAFASGLCAETVVMQTREFKVDFNLRELGRSMAEPEATPSNPKDPFAQPAATFVLQEPAPILTSKVILSRLGIPFPAGASAFYDSSTSILRVRNTPEMLELVEVLVNSTGECFPRDLVFTITVVEGPGEIIRETNAAAARTADAGAELSKLLEKTKKAGSKVRIVRDAWIETLSGTRATTSAVQEHRHVTGLTFDAQGHATLKQEMRPLGLQFDLGPTIGSDGITISTALSLGLDLAPPERHPTSITEPGTGNVAEFATTDFYHAEFETAIALKSGGTKLIGITAPLGKTNPQDGVLWAAFLTATIHTQEPLLAPAPKPTTPGKALPAGLQATALAAPDGLFAEQWGQPVRPLQAWFEAHGVPAAKGATAVQQNGVLQIVNTPDNIERIAALTYAALEQAAKSIACTLHTVQAPAALLRELTRSATTANDHSTLWKQVEAAVTRGEGRFINSLFIETKSEIRAKHASSSAHMYLGEFGLDAKGRPSLGIVYRDVGSVFEIEPTLQADGRTVNLSLTYELHPAPPDTRREVFRDPASSLSFDIPVVDFHSVRTTNSLTMTKGGTRLLSLNQPTGRDAEGMLWATFIKCDVIPQLMPPKVTPIPAWVAARVAPKAWKTQTFRITPDFLTADGKDDKKPRTAQSVLEAAGILFPQGATAIFDPLHSRLIVRNTQENLDLVEAYSTGLDDGRWPSTIAYTAQVFQGPGTLLRQITSQAAGKCDQRAELDALLAAVKAGTVQALGTSRIETRFGTRAMASQAREHTALSGIKVNDKHETEFIQDMRNVGLTLSIEPTSRADGRAIDSTLGCEFHPAEPLEHREHVIDSKGRRLELPFTDYQVVELVTGTPIPDGCARLIGVWKPTGKPEFVQGDILQLLFITCDHHPVEP